MKKRELDTIKASTKCVLVKFLDGALGMVDLRTEDVAHVYIAEADTIRKVDIFNLSDVGQGMLRENKFVRPALSPQKTA